METRWTPVIESLPPRTGVWQVTRAGGYLDQGVFLHPDDPPCVRKEDRWLGPGWYFLDHRPMDDVLAWMPPLQPYDGKHSAYPNQGRRARPGDQITRERVEVGRSLLLQIEITGGEPLKDSIQMNDARAAIDALFEALCPSSLENVRVFLLT